MTNPTLVHEILHDGVTAEQTPKLLPLRGLTASHDAILDAWHARLEACMNGFSALATRMSDCTPRCRIDCQNDGFHGEAYQKYDQNFSLLTDVFHAMDASGVAA
jgi:hypothetical protein